jgi:hypothetical protein
MADICPNINVPEWKRMIHHVGEREAYRAYMAHGYTIPNAVTMSSLKKTIGLTGAPYTSLRQAKINDRIRKFNNENGTSHQIKYTQIGESNSFRGELIFNYLPVNKQLQAERDMRRNGQDYIGVEDGESFDNVVDPNKEPFTPSESEMEAGRFEDGDFLPPSYMPSPGREKKGPKFGEYIAIKEADLQALYAQKDKLKIKQRTTEDDALKRKIRIKLQSVRKSIDIAQDKLVELNNLERLSQIEAFAEDDLATLEKIFNSPNPLPSDLIIADRLIKTWQRAGDFSGNEPHIFYDPEEFEARGKGYKEITEQFEAWAKRADEYNVKLVELREKVVKGEVLETFPGAEIDFDNPIPDINILVKNFLDISEVDHVLLQTMATWVKDANWAAKLELDEKFAELDRLIDATGLSSFDIFQQTFSNTDNRKTGEMVHRWSQSYFDWESSINKKRNSAQHVATGLEQKGTKEANRRAIEIRVRANRDYIESLRENTTFFDARILFPDPDGPQPTEEQVSRHIDKLKALLGETGYESYYKFHEQKMENYKEDLIAERRRLEGVFGENQAEIEREMDSFIARNSPYVFAEVMEKGYDAVKYNGIHVYPTNRYVRPIPKKTVNGEDTGFYDAKFQKIEDNQTYLDLYDYMFDMLQELKLYLPESKVGFMHLNSIPSVKKKVLENMTGDDGSLAGAFSRSQEAIRESVRDNDLSDVTTPEERKEHQFYMLQNNKDRIQQYVELQDTKYRAENDNEAPSPEMIAEWRKVIMDEIAQEKSFDLGRVMKAFASLSVTYKHRASVEDQMRLSQDIINRSFEQRQNAKGDAMKDKDGNLISDKGLKNLKEMLDDFMDVAYWGYPQDRPYGQGKKKVLTKKEKLLKESLEESKKDLKKLRDDGHIDKEEYDTRLDVLDDQIDTIGGVRAASKYGDILLKYVQLKGMGWNVYAAFANMGFGIISNIIEASDGRNYSMKSYRKAMALTLNSVGRNFTFNSWDGLNGQAKKIRILMDYYDTLKESKNEIYKSSTKTLFKKVNGVLEWANPYSPQSRSEYFNQAPVMIAMLMEQKVKTADGKEISLWDAYETDGSIKEGVEFQKGEKLDFEMKRMIDKVVKMNHGNYDPDTPLAIKREMHGRALSQFRTWMFQGFAERFKKEFKDHQLHDRINPDSDFVNRKGRYRSYVAYFRETNGLMGTGSPVFLLQQLFGKLIGIHTKFDDMISEDSAFTEADAANMRKNMTELVIYGMLASLALILKAAVDDEDDPKKKFAYYFLINQGSRLTTDIWFYTNPIEFERLFRNAIPAFSLVVDMAKFLESASTLISEGEDILQSGPNKGESRTWRDFKKLIPGAAQATKLQSAGSQEYKKK